MRKWKIVADSSADVTELAQVPFAAAPMKVITAQREFIDDAALDVAAMTEYFYSYKGRSQTSCPNPQDWLEAFGDADDIFCVTITSGLSGSHNAACIAKEMYEGENPGRRVFVIDSLSAGPELRLTIEELERYIVEGLPYEEICSRIEAYKANTGLLFMLESLKNFAANGRVSPAVAKITGFLGIRVVGKASDQGTLEPLDKCRGEKSALEKIIGHLMRSGLKEGRVCIDHCDNPEGAAKLKEMIRQTLPDVQVQIGRCNGLCSYYAEKGGLLVGFEKR